MEAAAAREPSSRAVLVLAGTAGVVYLLDQLTKAAVASALPLGERVPVIGDTVQLWHLRNTGAAFSLFEDQLWLFVGVAVVAVVMVAWLHRSMRDRTLWLHAILGLVLAGTFGNLTDRVRQGYVVDFLSVGIGDLRWPAFNVADTAVVGGIGLLVVYLTIADRRDAAEAAAE